MAKEWTKYRVGSPSKDPGWDEKSCRPLTTASHVAHIHHAWEYLRDGEIRGRLVSDKSKLKDDRYPVVWLSPNDWVNGSRYGTVEFEFDWNWLIEHTKAYWVEAITEYQPEAPRILLASDESKVPDDLTLYDPYAGDGPWWTDPSDGSHWWNGKYTLEILTDFDLPLTQCKQIWFVRHHPSMCCLKKPASGCWESKMTSEVARNYFFCGLIGAERRLKSRKLLAPDGQPCEELITWLKSLRFEVEARFDSPAASIQASDTFAASFARSFILALRLGIEAEEPDHIASAFASEKELWAACCQVVDDYFKLAKPGIAGHIKGP